MTSLDWGVQWPDVVQAGTSVLAFFALPQVAITLWNKTRYAIKVTTIPVDPNPWGSSNSWQLAVSNTSGRKLRAFKLLAIPTRPGANIIYATMQGAEDGGLRAPNSALSEGGFLIDIDRLGPRRTAYFLLRMTAPGSLFLHCDTLAVRTIHELAAGPSREALTLTMQLRVATLLMQFVFAIIVVLGRIVYLGIFRT